MATLVTEPVPNVDEFDPDTLKQLIYAILTLAGELVEHPLYDYQEEFGERFIESVLINDGEEITLLCSRQSGKTEAVSACIASMMVLLPRLALVYPALLGMFKPGLMVGVFAPVEEQSMTMFQRVRGALTSNAAKEVLQDDEIDDVVGKDGIKTVLLKNCKSFCRSQTAHQKAAIESKSYHIVIVDEAQSAHGPTVTKSIHPMLAAYNGTIIKCGSGSRTKGDFHRAIKQNQRRQNIKGAKQNHFEYDWRVCVRSNSKYAKFIEKEKDRLGEESDEFLLSYCCKFLLDRGMFLSEQLFDALSDNKMSIVQRHHSSPLVAGLDVARKMDSTVLTILWVDWDHPDPRTRLLDCRVLNWLEIQGDPGGKWHSRYNAICDFLDNYSVTIIGVDGQGMGDVVAEDLQAMLPNIDVRALNGNTINQSEQWKHLLTLMQHGMIGWPGSSTAKKVRVWQRFKTQMTELEKLYKGDGGRYLMAAAPDVSGANDDMPDSLKLATWIPKEDYMPTVEVVAENPFFRRKMKGY